MRLILWILGLLIAAGAVSYLLARQQAMYSRIGAAVGSLTYAPMVFLGSLWPSMHTLLGLVVLPALVICVASIFRPQLTEHRAIKLYLQVTIWLPAISLSRCYW